MIASLMLCCCLAAAIAAPTQPIVTISMFPSSVYHVRPITKFHNEEFYFVPLCLYNPSFVYTDLIDETLRRDISLEDSDRLLKGTGIRVPTSNIVLIADRSLQ